MIAAVPAFLHHPPRRIPTAVRPVPSLLSQTQANLFPQQQCLQIPLNSSSARTAATSSPSQHPSNLSAAATLTRTQNPLRHLNLITKRRKQRKKHLLPHKSRLPRPHLRQSQSPCKKNQSQTAPLLKAANKKTLNPQT